MEKEKMKVVIKNLSVYISYLTLIGIGFYIGSTYTELKMKPVQKTVSVTKKEISIAINESKQLLIIDKVTGSYTTYSDSIGMSIFSMYANRLSQKVIKDCK